jgi:plastocyanin
VRFRWPLTLAIAALLTVPASAADQTITAQASIQFSPNDVTIDMGDTVTWNNGGGTHNVEFDDGSFTEPPTPRPDDWSVQRTFDTPGQFLYHCGFHGQAMSGVVRVRDETGQVPLTPPGLTVSAADEQPLGRLERKGLRVRATCDNRCDISMKMSLAPRTAKRFGFAKRRKTIGRESDAISGGETERFFIELKPKAEDALADAERAFKVRLDVRATANTSETARRKIKITP